MPDVPHPEVTMLIPGDSIDTSPEWVSATRRCFPLLPDEEIIRAFEGLQSTAALYQGVLDAEVDRA